MLSIQAVRGLPRLRELALFLADVRIHKCCVRIIPRFRTGAFGTGGVRNWGRNRAVKTNRLVMVALCNRADHYIFILFLLSFFFFLLSSCFFSSPNLSGRRLDVYHTTAHGVALVRI